MASPPPTNKATNRQPVPRRPVNLNQMLLTIAIFAAAIVVVWTKQPPMELYLQIGTTALGVLYTAVVLPRVIQAFKRQPPRGKR